MKILLGQKVGMTQVWDDKGRLIAATVISAAPNKVVKQANKTLLATTKAGKTNKAQHDLQKAVGTDGGIWVKQVSAIETDKDSLGVDQFEVGDAVKVAGVTKGKGFAGTIKRHNFHRGPVSHGSDNVRRPGSIGAQRPQRVPKGQKMAGHMGAVNFTARGAKVLEVLPDQQLLIISGAVPGPNKGNVVIKTD